MISYLFKNNQNIDENLLLDFFKINFNLQEIENFVGNIILASTEMFVDINPQYISILLYNETINIQPIKKYIMEKYYGKGKKKTCNAF